MKTNETAKNIDFPKNKSLNCTPVAAYVNNHSARTANTCKCDFPCTKLLGGGRSELHPFSTLRSKTRSTRSGWGGASFNYFTPTPQFPDGAISSLQLKTLIYKLFSGDLLLSGCLLNKLMLKRRYLEFKDTSN